MTAEQQKRSPILRAVNSTAAAAWEVALTVLQVVLFSSVFLGILQLSLPKGTGLENVYGDILGLREDRAAVALNSDTLYDLGPLATLTAVTRRVKDRPANGIAWADSATGMDLEDRHAVQTLTRSAATITFQDENKLWLEENSLVVLKRPSRGLRRSRRAMLAVLGGTVRGSILPKAAGGTALGLETPVGEARIRSASEDSAEFSVTVNADQSSTVAVLSGTAEIEADGRKLELGLKQALTIDASGAVGNPIRIPEPPRQQMPAEGLVHTTGPSTPPLEFRWRRAARADAYRLVIARDAGFEDVIFDGRTEMTGTRPANLTPGSYHWRLSSFADRSESEPGAARSFTVVGDTTAPQLVVTLPEGTVHSDRLVVSGTTEPGSRLLVADRAVELNPDGTFAEQIELRPGPNLIVVESVDAAGNVAYHSQYVYAQF